MSVIATLVVGKDGSTSKNGSSAGVTTSADRGKFLARRRLADCILIGGNTARNEPYYRTPIPVVVVSHSTLNALADNSNAHWWNTSPEIALARAIATFGPNVVIEAGAEMISRLADLGLVDALELSVTDVIDGVQPIDYKKLLAKFSIVSETQIDSTIFYTATK